MMKLLEEPFIREALANVALKPSLDQLAETF